MRFCEDEHGNIQAAIDIGELSQLRFKAARWDWIEEHATPFHLDGSTVWVVAIESNEPNLAAAIADGQAAEDKRRFLESS